MRWDWERIVPVGFREKSLTLVRFGNPIYTRPDVWSLFRHRPSPRQLPKVCPDRPHWSHIDLAVKEATVQDEPVT